MTRRADLVPFPQRAGALQLARALLCVTVAATVELAGGVVAPRGGVDLVVVSVTYLVLSTAAEALRRLTGRRGLELVSALLLADGVYLVAVLAATSGTRSPLLFLVHLHIVAVALLASFLSGVAIAGWHALLLVTAVRADWIVGSTPTSGAALALAIVSYGVVAAATGASARLNERALQDTRWATATLLDLGSALEGCRTVDELTLVGAAHLRQWAGLGRVAVLIRGDGCWSGAIATRRGVVGSELLIDPGRRTGPAERELQVRLDADRWPELHAALPAACNVVVLPLLADGRHVGVAAIEWGPVRRAVPVYQLQRMEQSAGRIALSVRAVQLLDEVERLATSDPLTGLPNRRLFAQALAREVGRARRYGTPLALAMLDVDHFKEVNDLHGHLVGDEVLRELATALRSATRPESVVARYGGEEFVVLLPDADRDDASAAAERLRMAAAHVRTVTVTLSIGVALLDDDADGDALVASADAALYEAKRLGRNRTVCRASRPADSVSRPGAR